MTFPTDSFKLMLSHPGKTRRLPWSPNVTTAEADWARLGKLLVTRRVRVDSRYKNRRTFVAETHTGSERSWYRLITDIETGARSNYSRETLAAMEVAYQLEPDSLVRTLRGGDIEPLREGSPVGEDTQLAPGQSSEIERILAGIRDEALSRDKTIGDILVERGLATPEDLTLSDQKKDDPLVRDILTSNLPEGTKNRLLMDYVDRRRINFREYGVQEESELTQKKPRGA